MIAETPTDELPKDRPVRIRITPWGIKMHWYHPTRDLPPFKLTIPREQWEQMAELIARHRAGFEAFVAFSPELLALHRIDAVLPPEPLGATPLVEMPRRSLTAATGGGVVLPEPVGETSFAATPLVTSQSVAPQSVAVPLVERPSVTAPSVTAPVVTAPVVTAPVVTAQLVATPLVETPSAGATKDRRGA